jgi:hypothetical protein
MGFDGQFVHDGRTSAPQQLFRFSSIANYLAAKSGANPFAYTNFTQLLGKLSFTMDTQLYSFFVQDDWQIAPTVKLLYGVRYDLYNYPTARPDSPFASSQKFNVDKNNFGPRVGVAWAVNPLTALRASTGVMYDQPILAAYEMALQQNGSPQTFSVQVNPTSAGAPAFPNTLSTPPPGFVLPTQSILTIDPAFRVARTWQNNVQIERALGRNYTATIGMTYVHGYDLPVVTDINLINPTGTLADGRPIFSTAVNASTRMDPRFNHINTVQAIADSTYRALTLQLGKRYSQGLDLNLSYTLGKGTDDAPLLSSLAVNGDDPRSDPTNLERDRGPNLLDVRHSFVGSVVFNPTVRPQNAVLRAIANNNQVGILMQFNSGLPFNVRTSQDLNQDGLGNNDRPLFVGRNPVYFPARYNVDLRYSRFIPVRGNLKGEIIGEFKNLFNRVQVSAVGPGQSAIVTTDALGSPLAPIPTSGEGFRPTAGYEQREFQLGFRFRF